MPSTGTAVFTLTRDELIAEAYRKARITSEGQAPSATQISEAASRLNMIIKNCMSNGLMLWTYKQYVVPLAAAQVQYFIGPGGNVNDVRPLRIMEYGNFIRQTISGQDFDTPVRLVSRQEYLGYGNKTAPGVVNAIYYDSGIQIPTNLGVTSPSAGTGSLFVFVAPQDTTYTLYLNGQRPLFDMDTGTDEFDFPSEWFMYLMYALAAEVLDDNEGSEQRITRLEKKAEDHREKLMDWSVETASTTFAPYYGGGGR